MKKNKSSIYPDALVFQPLRHQHKQSFIILHGRGSNAEKFGPELLNAGIPEMGNLLQIFPYATFIIPTASKRRALIYKRTPIHQWFDCWSLAEPTKHPELQNDGLRETSAYIHSLLRAEIDAVGAANVILWGLSQGCAATLITLLTWAGPPLAAAVGMCGWIPYRKSMEDTARGEHEDEGEDDDPFERSEIEEDKDLPNNPADPVSQANLPTIQALKYLFEEIEWPTQQPSLVFQHIPLFLGHGALDEKVPLSFGRDAASCLSAMGMNVQTNQYKSLGHWYSIEMLRDIVAFVKDKPGWGDV